jgi:SAM-dependent methyltransferase
VLPASARRWPERRRSTSGAGPGWTRSTSRDSARRARERARRHAFLLTVVVADAERLPFPDRSIDLVYVHDGLHHLEDPLVGLDEMARVARVAVSVNDPARAAATRLAERLRSPRGVRMRATGVARVDPNAIASMLEASGFEIVRKRRYAMVYRHEPGRASALPSVPPVFPVLGGLGNKLTVQAVRRDG